MQVSTRDHPKGGLPLVSAASRLIGTLLSLGSASARTDYPVKMRSLLQYSGALIAAYVASWSIAYAVITIGVVNRLDFDQYFKWLV